VTPTHLTTHCHLCGEAAVAVFYFSHGCACDPATVQPLCPSHAFKSRPAGDGTMELIKDLTVGGAFTDAWTNPTAARVHRCP
jgi:hypothetical protein